MIPKPGKPPSDLTSYRPISILPLLSKLFEKILIKRLNKIIEEKSLIPNHQSGFRNEHSTIDQVHRITGKIEKAFEEKKIYSAIFLDIAQAFNKIWHKELIHKLQKHLPKHLTLREIKAGVPQYSVLRPVLYLLFTSDLPESEEITMADFADDTAALAVGETVEEAKKSFKRQ